MSTDYESTFQKDVTELVMRHIDRMNDVCEQDTADNIIASFIAQFDPLFDTYIAEKRSDKSSAEKAAVLSPWRVGEFWSSSSPDEKVLCLRVADDIAGAEKHSSFIRWVSPPAAMLDGGAGGLSDTERLDFMIATAHYLTLNGTDWNDCGWFVWCPSNPNSLYTNNYATAREAIDAAKRATESKGDKS